MKKERATATTPSMAKERSRRGFRPTRWRPELERLELRQTPAVFMVNTALDTVAANLQTGKDAAGHISLRSAIMAANAQPGADSILLPSGFFRLTIAGTGEDAAASGDLDIRSDVTIQGRGTCATTIDGNGLDRVFDVLSGMASLSQLTIQDGRSTQGGGLLNEGGQVSLSGVVVRNNLAIGLDGAAGANGVLDGAPQDMIGRPGQDGGAAIGGGISNASGSLTLVDSNVSNNQAVGGRGGRGGNGADLTGADGASSPIQGMSDGQGATGGDAGSGGRGGSAEGGGVFSALRATFAASGTLLANNPRARSRRVRCPRSTAAPCQRRHRLPSSGTEAPAHRASSAWASVAGSTFRPPAVRPCRIRAPHRHPGLDQQPGHRRHVLAVTPFPGRTAIAARPDETARAGRRS